MTLLLNTSKVVASRVIAVIGGYRQNNLARGHNILKNHTTNKTLLGKPLAQVGLILFVAFVATILISTIVSAQSEHATGTVNSETSQTNADSIITSESFNNNNYRPYLIKIVDGDSVITTPVVHDDPESILNVAGIIVHPEDEYTLERNSDHRKEPLVGFTLFIDRATPIEISLHGSVSKVRTQSTTVADLLDEKHLSLSETDVVKPSLESKITSGMSIAIIRVGTETVTVEEDIDFKREFIDDENMSYGTEKIIKAGIKGKARVTYEITYHDNTEVSRVKTKSITLKESTREIVSRGTKGAPVSGGPLNAAQIQYLGSCESGMTATRNSGNGYYGAFQFSAGTWNAMGTGYARADLAPLDVQIQAVQQLLSRSSIFGQFPGCANSMVAAGLL